jgi:hypothetical protein
MIRYLLAQPAPAFFDKRMKKTWFFIGITSLLFSIHIIFRRGVFMKTHNILLAGVLIVSGIITGCSPSFVMMKQFVDVDEMLLLAPKMKKPTLLQYLGSPAAVRAGIQLRDSTLVEIWFYNVREKMIKLPADKVTEKPPKLFKASYWDEAKIYALFIVNDGLVKWGYLEDVWPQLEKAGDIVIKAGGENGGGSAQSVGPDSKRGLLGIFKK